MSRFRVAATLGVVVLCLLPAQLPAEAQGPPTPYDTDALDRDMQRILAARQHQLSPRDAQAKAALLTAIRTSALGTLTHRVQYIQPPLDQVQITLLDDGSFYGTSVDEIKQSAIDGLKGQFGFSDQGLCDLPLVFGLDFDTKIQMLQDGLTFDPTFGCAE